jgi:hypothetical protein
LVDFIEEVEEQLRAERYATLTRRFLPWFAIALIATVVGWLGVWGYDSWRDHRIGAASVAYDKGLTALAGGDQAGAFDAFGTVAKDGPAAYRTLALMQQANIRFGADSAAEAIRLYDAAAKAAPSPILRDLASLRAAQVAMDTAPYAQVESRLKPLIGDKHPYSLEARETLAMAKLQAGKIQEAKNDFNVLTLTLGVTPSLRARAQRAVALIDSGQAALVAQAVKVAALPLSSAAPLAPETFGAAPADDSTDTQDQGGATAQDPAQAPSGNPQ